MFLGTGTSFGVPVIGCDCAACTSVDARDRRTRHGALLRSADGSRTLLIDTPPELRLQLVRAGVSAIDAVWYTHAHADHTHGIDDLRVFSARARRPLEAWADPETARQLHTRFDYVFDRNYSPPRGTTRPEIELRTFDPRHQIEVAGFPLQPIPVQHGDVVAYGFRVGPLGYVTDAKELTDSALDALRGVRVLVVNALWYGRTHPTHFNVEEAIAFAAEVGARRTYLTHLTHREVHADLVERLPPGIEPAYDGLEIDIDTAEGGLDP